MIVGNMGSTSRMDYTILGDAVNLGSRLESVNKQYGTNIIISQFTYEVVKEKFICRELDTVIVKGKTEPIKIYELISSDFKQKPDWIKLYNKALENYQNQDWSEALELFIEALKLKEDDITIKKYIKRCEELINQPPIEKWSYVVELTSKQFGSAQFSLTLMYLTEYLHEKRTLH